MDSNTSGFLLSSTLQSAHFEAKQDGDHGSIDLGLSLRTLQPEDYHPSGSSRLLSLEGYDDWPHEANLNLNSLNSMHRRNIPEGCDEESEGVQSKESWGYVKVNMDGVIVGRKICIPDHGDYSGLAYHLEDMFGTQVVSGLRLFQDGSEFTLLYKDRSEENWRAVGDVPWKVFVQCVKRLRIARKNADPVPGSSSKFT
ncbi:auxin-responsive protein IAA32-like [Juglans microcarpa x Juglans regia]|uniref:auxin-responsive protein IAA32-like n=1 Tax=Juglans microcarpa x Juglans regia TaxID=2249226 RepID=UPI001B7DCC51|nr:auxin-responsive protein IAA32-like [Juglans microcarpa x Juglans regia]